MSAAAPLPSDSAARRSVGGLAALLVLAVGLAYANTLQVPFLLDDSSAITGNASLADLGRIGTVLAPAGTTTSGRPLLNLSFALNHAWGGESVAGYHAVNLILHALATLALFGVVRRTLLSPRLAARWGATALPVAAGTALLWGVHPLLTSAVTYLSQRAESMMGLWYLLTLYAFLRGAASPQPARWLLVSVAACAAGMLTKEVMMTAPVLVLLFDRVLFAASWQATLTRRWYYAGLALCWVLLAWLMVSSGLGGRDVGLRAGDDWLFYAYTESKALVTYARLALVPYPLVFDYGTEVLVREFRTAAPYALLVLGGLAATGWLFRRGAAAAGLAAAAVFVVLAPTSSFVPVMGQPIAESRMYLPLAALVALGVCGLHRLAGRAALPVVAGLAVLLGTGTFLRNRDYRTALGLWTDTVQRMPGSARGHYNLANELVREPGRSAEAIAHYETALQIKPDLVAAHHNLANELAQQPGREAEALAHYTAALALAPDLAEAHANAARLLAGWPGREAERLGHLEAVARLQPASAAAQFQLANALAQVPERAAEAIPAYEAALRLRPDFPEAHNNLANLLAHDPARLAEALAHYETALRLKPDFTEAHYNYANRLARLPGGWARAVPQYEAALRLNPQLAEAHKNLALALANLGRLDEAAAHLEAALALRPDYREARELLERVRAYPRP